MKLCNVIVWFSYLENVQQRSFPGEKGFFQKFSIERTEETRDSRPYRVCVLAKFYSNRAILNFWRSTEVAVVN